MPPFEHVSSEHFLSIWVLTQMLRYFSSDNIFLSFYPKQNASGIFYSLLSRSEIATAQDLATHSLRRSKGSREVPQNVDGATDGVTDCCNKFLSTSLSCRGKYLTPFNWKILNALATIKRDIFATSYKLLRPSCVKRQTPIKRKRHGVHRCQTPNTTDKMPRSPRCCLFNGCIPTTKVATSAQSGHSPLPDNSSRLVY